MEDQELMKKDKKQQNDVEEANEFMTMIGKQQEQLTSLVRQTRMLNENKLSYENQQLTERLKMLEQMNEQRKMKYQPSEKKEKRKKHKKKRKHRRNKDFPPYPYGPMYPPMPGMYGGMPQYPPAMNYPVYNQGGAGMYNPGYPNMPPNNNYSALAGAGMNALNMGGGGGYGYQSDSNQYRSQQELVPANFDDPGEILDGRDINDSNKDQLKALLATQLGNATNAGPRIRPPSGS